MEEKGIKYFVTAGGVAANKRLRERLSNICEEKNIDYCFPAIRYCTDNAAMIAAAGYYYFLKNRTSGFIINAKSSEVLK